MAGRLVLDAGPAEAGARLDVAIARLAPALSRARVQRLVAGGKVRLDGRPARGSARLRGGERIEVDLPEPEPSGWIPQDLPLAVLHEDADLVVLDKAPGMVVHPARGAPHSTVVNALLHRLGAGAAGVRAGLVHRLDRDTSGVLLVARNAAALAGLARQFHDRTVEKRYLAVVHGRVGRAAGVIDRPIGRHPRQRQRMSVHSRRGRVAVTTFEVLERLPRATLLALRPRTGRTHQLRVHLAAMGHPIVGDRVYGTRAAGRRTARAPATDPLAAFPRQALHAESIRFLQPTSGLAVSVRAPLPPDFAALLAALRGTAWNPTDPATLA